MKVYEYYEDPEFIFVVTDLCDGGELIENILEVEQFTEGKAAGLMHQILSAVNYCHQRNIVHR